VGGSVEVAETGLSVRVTLKNAGDRATGAVNLEGELLGRQDVGRLEEGVPAGQARSLVLRYPPDLPRPGVYALTLLVDFAEATPGADSNTPTVSQRAFLLLALGASPEPAVKVEAAEGRLDTRSDLAVGLESQDGAAHRVRLRVLTPHGLRAENPIAEVAVPPAGRVSVPVPLYRANAPRGSQQGVLLVAETSDGPLARTAVATAVVDIAPDSAWLPRLRLPLFVLAVLLLLTAVALELRPGRAPA
jgi:hypothetical protein